MSMTLDDLERIFDGAYCVNLDDRTTTISSDKAGIIAVVKALRDEFQRLDEDAWVRFNDILAQSEARQAGVLAVESREVATVPEATEAPAAAPSTEVCEWSVSRDPDGEGHYETRCGNGWMMAVSPPPARDGYNFCPSCGKPITFKEAK